MYQKGDHTNINYDDRFEEYLDLLTRGLRENSPSILHVFSEWDRILFPDSQASRSDPQKKRRRKSDGYHRAIEAMSAEIRGQGDPENDDNQADGAQSEDEDESDQGK